MTSFSAPPLLTDIVSSADEIPVLPVDTSGGTAPAAWTPEMTHLLHSALYRELDEVIDGALQERLRGAVEEIAAGIKVQVRTQLAATLPGLIESLLQHPRR